jgi:hypothetical protein
MMAAGGIMQHQNGDAGNTDNALTVANPKKYFVINSRELYYSKVSRAGERLEFYLFSLVLSLSYSNSPVYHIYHNVYNYSPGAGS